ncbi:MAG: hypothetical protein BM560_19035 [Roseobacter sp. MedPE-SWde]|nr:MAG: hypothetical protein BM560_19035 [Roseobacter sp. MedPE-SWde]
MTWLGGLILAILGFGFGRIFNQAEAVLAEKRRVYEEFLKGIPSPNDAYVQCSDTVSEERADAVKKHYGPLMLYAAPTVALAASRYLQAFEQADIELSPESEPLHPKFRDLAKAQNDLILEMRRDALGWSMFGYYGKSRLPEDALEQAKRNAL